MAWVSAAARAVRNFLPAGAGLPQDAWRARHVGILVLLALHAVGLAAFALYRGFPVGHALIEGGVVGVLAIAAGWPGLNRRFAAAVASSGLITSSAVLVHLSGGYIEAHFHFFVMLGVISLYQDWVPFFIAVGYVALHHGLAGVLAPASVYNHPDAVADPWKWAAIHAVFVLGLSVANLVTWRVMEAAAAKQHVAEVERAKTVSTLTATLESTADGLLVVSRDGRMTAFNQRFVQMWGLPREVVETRDESRAVAHLLPHLEDPDAFVARRKALHADEDAESFDVLDLKDGRVFERYSAPQRADGETVGRVWSFRDVTERRRAETARIASLARERELEHLKEMDDFRTRFINSAAHELNTPLTPMRIQVHLLATQMREMSDAQRQSLEILRRNFKRFDRLVGDVLASAKLQAESFAIEREQVNLAALVPEALASFDAAAREAGIALESRVDRDLWVEADPSRLTQVVDNLMTNALKFTPRGGRISVTATGDAREVVFAVRDTGIGLTSEQMGRLFQPFSQVHEDVAGRGTGLGLYISRGIVDLHDGRVRAESAGPGRGATFTVALPRAGTALPAAGPAGPRPEASGA